jgi:hypothetical protein
MIDVDKELEKHAHELTVAVEIAAMADAIFYIGYEEVSDYFYVHLEKFYFDNCIKVCERFSFNEPYEDNMIKTVKFCIQTLDDCCNESTRTKRIQRTVDLLRSDHIWIDIQKPIVSKEMVTEKTSAVRFIPLVKAKK